MTNTIGLDGHRLRGHEQDEPIEEYPNDRSLSLPSSSSSSSYRFGNDHAIFEDELTAPRQLDEVTKLSSTTCSLTTSLRAGYKGWNTASGFIFTIKPSTEAIELLTLEFPTFEDYFSDSNTLAARKVQVYYRLGSFSGVMNDPSAWTLIADTNARLVSPLPSLDSSNPTGLDMGAIVPANEFKSVTLEAGQIYSIYISGEASSPNPTKTMLKLKPADGLVGEVSTENKLLQVQTGVRLKGSPFPSVFDEPAEFNGVLHYRATKSCNDSSMFTTTDVVLEFAVNKEPTSKVMGSVRSAVDETLSEWLSTNEVLVRYSEEDMLKMEAIATHFKGRSEEKCPIDFENCSVIAATVSLKHLHNLDPGLLQMEILRQHQELDEFVYSYMSPLETAYVKNPLSKVDFAITLSGVPTGEEMNEIQKRYFEEVTVNFLRNSIESNVFNAIVIDEVPETLFVEDGEQPVSRNLVRMPTLRTKRKMEGTASSGGKIQIITEIAAEASVQDLRSMVLERIGNNPTEFTMELISQHMRPVEINEKDYGDFFAGLTNVQVKPHMKTSTGGGSTPDGGNGVSSPVANGGSVWVIVCILLIVFSFLWICYRVYMDCFYSPFEKVVKLSHGKDEFKDEEESERNGVFKNSLFGRMKSSSASQRVSGSDVTPNSDASSKTFGKNQSSIPKAHAFSDLLARDPTKSLSDTAPPKISYDDDDDSLSFGDVESSDEESCRSPRGPKRGKLAPSKSMPVQNGNRQSTDKKKQRKSNTKSSISENPQRSVPHRSPAGPTRGRLTPSKSMPVQKKAGTKSPQSDRPKRQASHRSPSGPRRGRLTATKSMPMQKRDQANSGADSKKRMKSSARSSASDKLKRSSHHSPSGPRRGRLAPSKSLPMQRSDVKHTNSMPLGQKKGESILAKKKRSQELLNKKLESRSSHSDLKRSSSHSYSKKLDGRSSHSYSKKPGSRSPRSAGKQLGSRSSRSDSKKLGSRSAHSEGKKLGSRSSHSDSRKLGNRSPHSKKLESRSSHSYLKNLESPSEHSYLKKLESRSSHSYSKKLETPSSHSSSKKKRGIKPSNSMPRQKRNMKSESESSIKKLIDMVHDSTDDSDDSLSSSEFASSNHSAYTNTTNTSDTLERIRRKSSPKSGTPKKAAEVRKSYGKAGKIQFGGANRGLPDVDEENCGRTT